MKKLVLVFISAILLFFSVTLIKAQENDLKETSEIIQPKLSAYLFDEYKIKEVSAENEKQRLESFVVQLKELSSARAVIYVYRGKTDYNFDGIQKAAELKIFLDNSGLGFYQSTANFAGFGDESAVELFIKPPDADYPLSTPTSFLDVKFYDDATLPKGTIQKTGNELLETITKKVEPFYPAAGKAVRASGVVAINIKIDENGKVTDAKTFLGHPLLRAACIAAVRNWQFKPEIQKAVPVKVVAIAICEFKLQNQ